MAMNNFGKTSKLNIVSEYKEGRTILTEASFTAPFKVMQPFYPQGENKRMQIMALSASAGLMEGDRQEINIVAKRDSELEFLSQSYEKIHNMQEGYAARKTEITVEKSASFFYNPLPVIPFAGSAFQSITTVHLEDKTAQFMMGEIMSCGRYACGERFRYRYYQSLLRVYCGYKLIFMDNTYFGPSDMQMEETGLMEGYSHLANVLLFNRQTSEGNLKEIHHKLLKADGIEGGVTTIASGDVIIRVLGNNAQMLETKVEKLINIFYEDVTKAPYK